MLASAFPVIYDWCSTSLDSVPGRRMIEKGTMYAGKRTIGHWVNTEVGGSVCTTARAWDAKNPVPTAPTKSSRPNTDHAIGILERGAERPLQRIADGMMGDVDGCRVRHTRAGGEVVIEP